MSNVMLGIEITDPPAWLVAYLAGLAGQRSSTDEIGMPRTWSTRLPRSEELESVSCSLQPTTTGRHRFELVGQIDDRTTDRFAALLDALIESATGEQVVSMTWTDSPWKATVHAIRASQRYQARPDAWLSPTGEPSSVVAGQISPGRERASLVRHGASRAVLDLADRTGADTTQPHLAGYLMARTLSRALAEHDALDALPDVLAALGLGEDQWGQSTAPGWRVAETADGTATGRWIDTLSDLGPAMAGSRLTGANLEIVPGTVLVARRQHMETLRLFGGGCRVISVGQGEQIVVTEFQQTGTGMGFGVARDARGAEVPFRGEFIGSIFDIVDN